MRVAVAASGRGSNLEALLRSLGPGAPARVVLVLSDRAAAGALTLARSHGVPSAGPRRPGEPGRVARGARASRRRPRGAGRLPEAGAAPGDRALSRPHHQHSPRAAARVRRPRDVRPPGARGGAGERRARERRHACIWWTRSTIGARSWPRPGSRCCPEDDAGPPRGAGARGRASTAPGGRARGGPGRTSRPTPRTRGVSSVIVPACLAR